MFLVLLAVGVVVRIAVTVAYRPGLSLYADSYSYLQDARRMVVGTFHPLGYPVLLRAVWWIHSILALVVLQHVLALLVGTLVYLALRRLGVRPWLAALGAAPVLLDAYEIDIEQFVLAETWFLVLLLVACLLVLVPRRVRTWHAATAGLLLAWAVLTRPVGGVALVTLGGYLLIRRVGWRPVVALGVCTVVPVLGYAAAFQHRYSHVGLEAVDGRWFYGRTAYFADCAKLPADQQPLCPAEPLSQRRSPDYYTWGHLSPLQTHYAGQFERDAKGQSFAVAVIAAQPLDYLQTTAVSLGRDLSPQRSFASYAWPVRVWQLTATMHPRRTNVAYASATFAKAQFPPRHPFRDTAPARSRVLGHALHAYQNVVYTWGPTLAIAVLLTLVALLVRGARRLRITVVAAALAATGVLLMVVPALTVVQDYRYLLPVNAVLWPAGVLAVEALITARRAPSVGAAGAEAAQAENAQEPRAERALDADDAHHDGDGA